jgi:hypothetical protein
MVERGHKEQETAGCTLGCIGVRYRATGLVKGAGTAAGASLVDE